MSENTTLTPQVETAKVRPPRKISIFWLLPVIAFIIGALLFFQILKERGEIITLHFTDGAGITAKKTPIRYQGLQIGLVKKVSFSEDLKNVDVIAEITPEASSLLREDTKFWLVQPSVSLAGVSGLDSIVSGNYITLLPGKGDEADEFIAELEPPVAPVTAGDLLIKLVSDDLGSISIGSNVYFKKVPVGSILSYRFTEDQQQVEIDVMIKKKYANLVKKNSHFWNISGINATLDLSGLSIAIDSIQSVVQGAIAFDSPKDDTQQAVQNQHYTLYKNLKAANRGIEVDVLLPLHSSVKVNETALFYQNTKIGVLAELDPIDTSMEQKVLKGKLLLNPNYTHLLRSGTTILLKEPKFGLNKQQITKLNELVRGNFFDVVKVGEGEELNTFSIQKEADYLLSRPDVLGLTLVASQSYGVDKGQGIYYNDIQIGEILERNVTLKNVSFKVMIYPEYRRFIAKNSQFVSISHFDLSANMDGVQFKSASPTEWLKGGIRMLVEEPKGKPLDSYPLYENRENAQQGIIDTQKRVTKVLSAKKVSGINKGSVILYNDFQVGEVLDITPKAEKFEIGLFIIPKYRHLLTNKSRFWIEPATAIDISTKGINIQAAPFMRTLKGAISFDNKGRKQSNTLYENYDKVFAGNSYITLITKDAAKLSEGMPIKYMGLTIGHIKTLKLENAKKRIKVTASIKSKYYGIVARSGSVFKAISPQINSSGFKHLDAVLQNYIDVNAGTGKRKTWFTLVDNDVTKTEYQGGFPIVLETSNANGLSVDTPVFYRGLQVGIVDRVKLSELGDRVFLYVRISYKYRHLVRKNSQFWESSGYTMNVGLNGATISSGTMSQLMNGGISFSTPSGKIVSSKAKANQHFILQPNPPKDVAEWNQGAY
ncbi:MlaD family protein [Pasteurella atlantica]|uniref:MlaD family protein n=2 Tax=Pasteurellaceae TaxID=712 RepID=A0ACC6HMQ3_9PAST|nr:MlaD family protein [Pasteurella atlantica]MDP8052145.1 MlaD family protein [Pasteurella atlantica]MDP8105232.1 MlaD family protein [Pasteurella atlantica]MDP8149047.1 MlaD family protein [Pasteurella atlantica]